MKSKHKDHASTYNLGAMREEWRELTYRIAATEYVEEEAKAKEKELDADVAAGKTKELDAHLAKVKPKALWVIQNAIRREHAGKFIKQTLPRIGHVAAALVLVFFLGLTVAIASSHVVRVKVMEFLVNIEEQYTELSLQENPERSFDIPAEWGGSYYPAEIPEGFTVAELYKSGQHFAVAMVFLEDTERCLFFGEYGEDSFTNLDTEGSVITAKMVNGSPALVAIKEGKVSVAWAQNNTYFTLTCEGLSEEQVLEIADSVTRVKK